MRLCDVIELDGEWVMRITDEGEDGKVKNRSSLRNLPIHPAVVEAGFLTFVQSRQCAPDDYLFREEKREGTGRLHDLALDADERVSGKYGKRFAADLKVLASSSRNWCFIASVIRGKMPPDKLTFLIGTAVLWWEEPPFAGTVRKGMAMALLFSRGERHWPRLTH